MQGGPACGLGGFGANEPGGVQKLESEEKSRKSGLKQQLLPPALIGVAMLAYAFIVWQWL